MVFAIASFSFTAYDFALIALAAALVGMAKTGVQGSGMIAVPMLALVFGAKASTGVMLPILIIADLFAVYYYNKHADWQHLKKLIPFAFVGVILGTAIGNTINETMFGYSMVVIIFAVLAIMIWQQKNAKADVPKSFWFVASIGIAGGFATMVGNLAGPIMALYLLSMKL
ncbi:MAG: putative membrane protein YfcA, partial [Arenicella sp.]